MEAETVSIAEGWSVKSTLIMWTLWARVACGQARRAREAQQAFDHAYGAEDSTVGSRALGDEMEAAVAGTCAATFAVEALVRSLATSLPRPAGKETNAARVERVLTASVVDPATAGALVDRWRPIITLRNATVHYDEEERDLGWHPSLLTRTAVEAQTYNAESAQAVAQLLIDTLAAVSDQPTPPIAGALPDAAGLVDELRPILRPSHEPIRGSGPT